jgi:hypothetical protein
MAPEVVAMVHEAPGCVRQPRFFHFLLALALDSPDKST